MANKYKVRSRGGRFKTLTVGDLGLRSYKEQQDELTDALKAQNIAKKQADESWLRDETRKDVKELENQQDLKTLDDKAWQTRKNAITVRQQNEVDYWMGVAAEYGKQEKFWSDFTRTGAATFGKLAGAVKGKVDQINAENLSEQFAKGGELWWLGADVELNGTIISANSLVGADGTQDPFVKQEGLRVSGSGNDAHSQIEASKVIKGKNGIAIVEKTKSIFNQNYNRKTAPQQITWAWKAYARDAGIKEGTSGYRDIQSHMNQLIGQEVRRLTNIDLFRSSETNTIKAVESYRAKPSTFNFNKLILTLTNSHTKPKGSSKIQGPADHKMDMREGYVKAIEVLMDNDVITDQDSLTIAESHLHPLRDKSGDIIASSLYKESEIPKSMMGEYLGSTAHLMKSESKRKSWNDRHNLTTYKYFEDLLLKKQQDLNEKETIKIKAIKQEEAADVNVRLNRPKGHEDYIDKSDPNQFGPYLDQYRNNEFVMKDWGYRYKFNPLSHTAGATQLHLVQAWKAKDIGAFMQVYNTLEKPAQNDRNWMLQSLKDWSDIGLTHSVLLEDAKNLRNQFEKDKLPNAIRDTSATRSFDQTYVNLYNQKDEIYSREFLDKERTKKNDQYIANPLKRRDTIRQEIKEMAGLKPDGTIIDSDKSSGLFRRQDPIEGTTGNVVWLAHTSEPEGNVVTKDKIIRWKNNGSVTYDEVIRMLTEAEEEHGSIETPDTIDSWIVQLSTGDQPLDISDNVRDIAYLWDKRPYEVINHILEKKGIKALNVTPNNADNAELNISAFDTIKGQITEKIKKEGFKLNVNQNFWKNLSDIDKVKVGFVGNMYQATGDVPKKPEIELYKEALVDQRPLTDLFTKATGINPTLETEDGLVVLPEVIKALPSYFPNYFYDYETNKIIKKRGK